MISYEPRPPLSFGGGSCSLVAEVHGVAGFSCSACNLLSRGVDAFPKESCSCVHVPTSELACIGKHLHWVEERMAVAGHPPCEVTWKRLSVEAFNHRSWRAGAGELCARSRGSSTCGFKMTWSPAAKPCFPASGSPTYEPSAEALPSLT